MCLLLFMQLWPQVFGHVVTALFMFQLFMIGILAVKQSYTSSVLVPLLFITAIFTMVCRSIFERPFQVMSLRGAVDLDNHEKVRKPDLIISSSLTAISAQHIPPAQILVSQMQSEPISCNPPADRPPQVCICLPSRIFQQICMCCGRLYDVYVVCLILLR